MLFRCNALFASDEKSLFSPRDGLILLNNQAFKSRPTLHIMNRTSILLILVLLLGAATFLYFQRGDDKTTLAGADRRFAVKNTDDVYKIFIADRQGNKTTLERKDGYWLYNGRWRTRPTAIGNLLQTIGGVEMKFKPPHAAVKNMVSSLAAEGIKVEIYDRKNKLLKSYYVGGATPDETGTYMILEGADQPYVTYLPGRQSNLRYRYSMKEDDWRDRSVFAYDPERIQAVSIEYPQQQNMSFRLERTGNKWNVKPFYDFTPASARAYRERSVDTYVIGFESLVAEAFENQLPERDSISTLVPFAVVKVTDDQKQVSEVRFHPIFNSGVYQDPKTGAYTSHSGAERYYANAVSGGDFFLVQHRVFQKIFWAYDSFFEP